MTLEAQHLADHKEKECEKRPMPPTPCRLGCGHVFAGNMDRCVRQGRTPTQTAAPVQHAAMLSAFCLCVSATDPTPFVHGALCGGLNAWRCCYVLRRFCAGAGMMW